MDLNRVNLALGPPSGWSWPPRKFKESDFMKLKVISISFYVYKSVDLTPMVAIEFDGDDMFPEYVLIVYTDEKGKPYENSIIDK